MVIMLLLQSTTRPTEFGSMTARKDHKMPYETIKRLYKAIKDHTRSHNASHIMAVKSNNKTIRGHIRPYKTTQGHTKPYKANTTIQSHNVPQKHVFCVLARFLFSCTFFVS